MANTTTAQITYAVNNWYDPVLLVKAVPALIHTRWAQVRDIPANNTDTIKFRRYSLLTAATTALSEGVTPSGSSLSITDVTATIAQYGDYVTFTDKVQFTTLDPLLTETSEILGQQAGNTLDQLTRDVLAAGTTVQYASTATQRTDITAAMKLTITEVRAAVLTLKNANAKQITQMIDANDSYNTTPLRRCYIGLVNPHTTNDLKGDTTNFIPIQKYPRQDDVMMDEVGAMDEVRFVESTNCKVFTAAGSGGADVYATLIFGENFYGTTRVSGQALRNIVKPLGSAGTADPLDQRSTMGWKATFVAVRLNETFAVRIEHGVTS